MGMAFERCIWPGVDGYVSARTTYDQFLIFFSAIVLALVTFAVETMISFLAKEHGQSVLRHGQSFARNSRFQRTLGASARTGRLLLFLSTFGMPPCGFLVPKACPTCPGGFRVCSPSRPPPVSSYEP